MQLAYKGGMVTLTGGMVSAVKHITGNKVITYLEKILLCESELHKRRTGLGRMNEYDIHAVPLEDFIAMLTKPSSGLLDAIKRFNL